MTIIEGERRHWRTRVGVLALGAFVVGTDGFVVVGLLPQVHTALDVSIAAAGQLVSVFSLAYAVLGPVLAATTGRWSRRRVLVAGIALLAAGNAVTASSPVFGLVLASRALAGVGAALYVASAVATAATVAGDERRGSAIAMVTAGVTSSLVLGAPLGTVVGSVWGWRTAIWGVAAVAALVAVVVAVLLPPIRLSGAATVRERVAPLTDRRVLEILAVTLLAFVGVFLPFTYLSAVFAPAVGADGRRLALLLLVFGVTATVGTLSAGTLADRYRPRRVVIGATLGVAAVCLLMIPARGSLVPAAIAVALSGVVSYSIIGPQQQRILARAPADGASLVTSLNTSTGYLGNVVAGTLGALALSAWGSTVPLLLAGALFAVAASLLAWWQPRRD